MKFNKLLAIAVAGFLLLGASNGMARVIGGWFVVGLEATDEEINQQALSTICVEARSQLRGMGYRYRDSASIEPRLVAHFFQSVFSNDAVSIFCLANIIEKQPDLFGDD